MQNIKSFQTTQITLWNIQIDHFIPTAIFFVSAML